MESCEERRCKHGYTYELSIPITVTNAFDISHTLKKLKCNIPNNHVNKPSTRVNSMDNGTALFTQGTGRSARSRRIFAYADVTRRDLMYVVTNRNGIVTG